MAAACRSMNVFHNTDADLFGYAITTIVERARTLSRFAHMSTRPFSVRSPTDKYGCRMLGRSFVNAGARFPSISGTSLSTDSLSWRIICTASSLFALHRRTHVWNEAMQYPDDSGVPCAIPSAPSLACSNPTPPNGSSNGKEIDTFGNEIITRPSYEMTAT